MLERAMQTAERYAVEPRVIEPVFRWIIEQTLDLEVRFLQQLFETRSAR